MKIQAIHVFLFTFYLILFGIPCCGISFLFFLENSILVKLVVPFSIFSFSSLPLLFFFPFLCLGGTNLPRPSHGAWLQRWWMIMFEFHNNGGIDACISEPWCTVFSVLNSTGHQYVLGVSTVHFKLLKNCQLLLLHYMSWVIFMLFAPQHFQLAV